jgi:glycosyltransferase involved in cell wall biosynthesis
VGEYLLDVLFIASLPKTHGGAARARRFIYHLINDYNYDISAVFLFDPGTPKEIIGELTQMKSLCRIFKLIPAPIPMTYDKPEAIFKAVVNNVMGTIANLRKVSHKTATLSSYYFPNVHRIIDSILDRHKFDVVFSSSLPLATYIWDRKDLRRVVDISDASHVTFRELYRIEKNPFRKMLWLALYTKKYKDFSSLSNADFDLCLALTKEDAKEIARLSKVSRIKVLPYGVDVQYFNPERVKSYEQTGSILFFGALDISYNAYEVLYFYRKIYPMIKSEYPDVRFIIAGRNPPRSIRKISVDPSVRVTGYVKDIRQLLASASVMVFPLMPVAGVRTKVLEAMAMAKPIVITSAGVRGIEVENEEHIIIADTPKEFAYSVISLLSDSKKRKSLGYNARKLVCEKYSWKHITDILHSYLLNLSNR